MYCDVSLKEQLISSLSTHAYVFVLFHWMPDMNRALFKYLNEKYRWRLETELECDDRVS